GNVHAFERIERTKHRRIRPIRQPRLQLVLTNLLARLEHELVAKGARLSRWSRLERRHIDVVEIPLIIPHVLYLTLQSHDHGRREIDALKTLGAAQAAGAKNIDFHELVAHDIQ